MARPEKTVETSWALKLASIAVVIGALYLAKGVLVPFALAVLLSFLLSPVCSWMERRGFSRLMAVLMTTSLGFTLLGLAAWAAVVQANGLTPKIPEYRRNIEAKFSSVNQYAISALGKLTRSSKELEKNLKPSEEAREPQGTEELPFAVRVLPSPMNPLQAFSGMFGTVVEVLGTAGIVVVFVMFFLFRREDLRDRFIHLVGKGHVTVTTQMLEDAATRVSHYLSIFFLLNAMFGISVGLGLFLIGVPNPILWGILAAALRFIPYLGPWIAAVMPIALSMSISTGWIPTLLTVGLFAGLELFNNNLLEPWLYGKNTGVSPVAVMLAAVFWTWLWGPVGLLLATPLTVCVLVIGKHVPQFAFLDILLGTEPVFEPMQRVYQRLLAGDQETAVELFEEYLAKRPNIEVYDTVLIPALAMAETHWQLGELSDGKHAFITQSLKEMIHAKDESRSEKQIQESASRSVLCLPVRTESDEIAALMLAQVLEAKDWRVDAIQATSSASDIIELLQQRNPDVVCLSATPPAAVMHARRLCLQIRERYPELRLIVGLWDTQGSLDKARARIGCDALIVSKLAEAKEHLQPSTTEPLTVIPKPLVTA